MTMKKTDDPAVHRQIHDAFNNPKHSPRPTRAQEVANTYARGAQRVAKLTGQRPAVPSYDKGLETFPPAKKMLEGGAR